MQLHTGHRSVPLVLKKAGQVPTLPKPLGLKVDANGWFETDLADGEYCINNVDDLFFWRSWDKIHTLNLSLIWTYINNFNSLSAGLMYRIPSGINIIVKNNHQYLIKDYLLLVGGSITLQGNAQLIIH